MIRQLFGMVVIVFFTVASLITSPTSVNAAGFFNQGQSTPQSTQSIQEDQYTEQEPYAKGNQYSQDEQTYPTQDSQYSSPNNQSIQGSEPYDQTQEQKS